MVEADGRIRIVDYTADSKSGFNAVVKHKGHAVHPHTKATSHSDLKLSPSQEETISKVLLAEEPRVSTHFESSHGVLPTQISLNEGETYQYTTEASFVTESSNEVTPVKNTYIYIPKTEEQPEEEIKYKYKHYYIPKIPFQAPVKEVQQELPIDLSLLKQGQKILPVDVSLIKPIEIDLSQTQPTNHKELSEEELKKFLNDYYKGDYNVAGEDELKPISKRPVTTPGLSNYSTQPGYSYPKPAYDRRASLRPVQFPVGEGDPQNDRLKRRLRRIANNGYVRYAKTVTYDEDGKKWQDSTKEEKF